jgi:hypothetical protein
MHEQVKILPDPLRSDPLQESKAFKDSKKVRSIGN